MCYQQVSLHSVKKIALWEIFPSFLLFFQLRVSAYDTAYPSAVTFIDIPVSVHRNPSAPQFSLPSYKEIISEDTPAGNVVVQIEATDADGVSTITNNIFSQDFISELLP